MCGICGELRFDGLSPDLDEIGRMSFKLARLGPDHAGIFPAMYADAQYILSPRSISF